MTDIPEHGGSTATCRFELSSSIKGVIYNWDNNTLTASEDSKNSIELYLVLLCLKALFKLSYSEKPSERLDLSHIRGTTRNPSIAILFDIMKEIWGLDPADDLGLASYVAPVDDGMTRKLVLSHVQSDRYYSFAWDTYDSGTVSEMLLADTDLQNQLNQLCDLNQIPMRIIAISDKEPVEHKSFWERLFRR